MGPINHPNGDQIVLKSTTPAVSGPMAVVGAQKKSAVNLKKKKKKRFYPMRKASSGSFRSKTITPLNRPCCARGKSLDTVYTALQETGTPSRLITVFPSLSANSFLSAQSERSLIWKLCLMPVETWKISVCVGGGEGANIPPGFTR